jgi:hypothetical protein
MALPLQMETSLPSQGSANYSGPFYEYINLKLQASVMFDTYRISEYGVRSVHETTVYTVTQKPKSPTRNWLDQNLKPLNIYYNFGQTCSSPHTTSDFQHQTWTLVT